MGVLASGFGVGGGFVFQWEFAHRVQIGFFEECGPEEQAGEKCEEEANGNDSEHAYPADVVNYVFDHISRMVGVFI
jgi:hypothetical protein